jgi:uncharacterized protein
VDFDWTLAAAALGIGIVVGLTGMGGGALMTPVLVLFFGIPPLTAVSSDLVAAAVMKPVGSAVHMKEGNVRWELVRWLCLGSVPGAFGGVLILRALGDDESVQNVIEIALGCALLLAAFGLGVRAWIAMVQRARVRDGRAPAHPPMLGKINVKPLPTVLIGLVGGIVVGITSAGSGSLIIIALMALYPGLLARELVGTDLVQAVPLVFSAAIGHILFGDFQLSLTLPLLVGSVPGAFIGAQLSSHLPGSIIRRALAFVLMASALKLLGVPTVTTGIILGIVLVLAPVAWALLRRHYGFPAIRPRRSKRLQAAAQTPETEPEPSARGG